MYIDPYGSNNYYYVKMFKKSIHLLFLHLNPHIFFNQFSFSLFLGNIQALFSTLGLLAWKPNLKYFVFCCCCCFFVCLNKGSVQGCSYRPLLWSGPNVAYSVFQRYCNSGQSSHSSIPGQNNTILEGFMRRFDQSLTIYIDKLIIYIFFC